MPHFTLMTDEDGVVQQVLKDGESSGEVTLEQCYAIVTVYFRSAESNVKAMEASADRSERRSLGLQSFLMSLTGLEAFANTFFHARARDIGNDQMVKRIGQPHGSLSRKIEELIALSDLAPLQDQQVLLDRVFQLSQLRNEIVHPRWDPATLTVAGAQAVHLDGLVENRQALFEDPALCREALAWCLLVIARIAQAQGAQDISSFMFYWTDNYDLGLNAILEALGLPNEDVASA